MKQTAPVVIIGAGPVGMFLALDLAHRGVASTIVERDAGSRTDPKGNTHNARTMEHYRRLGLADDVRALGLPSNQPTDVVYVTRLDGLELGRIPMPSAAKKLADRDRRDRLDQVPEPLHRANQMNVEGLIIERVKANPLITSLFGWEFVEWRQAEDGLEVEVRAPESGEARTLACNYLVGCDGGRSPVRRSLDIRFSGEDTFDEGYMGGGMRANHFRISNLYDVYKHVRGWQYWVLNHRLIVGMVDINGKDEFLVHTAMEQAPTETDVVALVRQIASAPLDLQLLSSRTWTAGRALVADAYGRGNVFLAGDAIHVFTPTGGFGMNTGVDDAANLAWKLAAVLGGWGGPRLLETYEAERRPIGIRNTTSARKHALHLRDLPLVAELEEDSAAGAAARAEVRKSVPAFAEEFASIGIQLGARYDQSPVIAHEAGAQPPPDEIERYVSTSQPGGRAPHLWLDDGRSLYDLLGRGFLLLRFADGPSIAPLAERARARGIPLNVADIRIEGAETFYPRRLALIRPDHYVAWRGDTVPDPDGLLSLVTGWREMAAATSPA